MHRSMLLAALVALAACGRSAGPNAEEADELTYWLVVNATTDASTCSNVDTIDKFRIQDVQLGGDVAYYFIYRVHSDFALATGYDCVDMQAYDPTQCKPNEQSWKVSGHSLSTSLDAGAVSIGSGCTAKGIYGVELEDDGNEGKAHETVTFQLIGDKDACDAAEAKLEAESPNGKGVRGCTFKRDDDLAFAKAVPKAS